MKRVLIVFTINVMMCKCYHFPEITIPQYYIPIVNIRGINESVVFIKENNTDDLLINSLILGLFSDQPIILSRGDEFYKKPPRRKVQLNWNPNLIIMTESLNIHELHSVPFKSILKSYWSPIYLIITTRNGNQTCENGTVSKAFFENAQDFMNTIWHRYKVVRATISFPYTCPHHYIIYSGKKPSHGTLYNRTIKIIKARDKKELETGILANSKIRDLTVGYPLRANIFSRFPTSTTQCDIVKYYKKMNLNYSNGFCGLDGLVMHDFVEHYRFNLSIPNDESCSIYGFVETETKIVSGSLGCVVRGLLDISFNSRFLVLYTTERYYYLHYITTDDLAVVLKRPAVIPLWHYSYNIFYPRIGIILFILILLLGVLTWASAWITKEITGIKPRKLNEYVLNTFSCAIFGFSILRKNDGCRILKGASLLCSIILLAIYQGNVNYRFTTRIRYREIRTLHQLYDSEYMLYTSPSILDLMISTANPSDRAQIEYLKRTQIKNERIGAEYILDHPLAATLARSEDAKIQILLNFTDEKGAPLVYVVDETFQAYYLSYIARPGFLFLEESLRFMMRMLEAGLPKMYYIWSRRSFKLGDTYPKTGSDPRPFATIKIQHLRVAFFVLAFGYLASTCSFLVEKYRGTIRARSQPKTKLMSWMKR